MPPSAAAESSKEVKLRKTCDRPIVWSGGGTRIHNFPLPGDFPYSIILWGRGKHDPSRHLSPDRRTRMGRIKISTMPPITLKVRRNRTDKSSWYFYRRVGSFVSKNDVKFWIVSSFANVSSFAIAAANLHMSYRLRYKNIAYNAGEFTR